MKVHAEQCRLDSGHAEVIYLQSSGCEKKIEHMMCTKYGTVHIFEIPKLKQKSKRYMAEMNGCKDICAVPR